MDAWYRGWRTLCDIFRVDSMCLTLVIFVCSPLWRKQDNYLYRFRSIVFSVVPANTFLIHFWDSSDDTCVGVIDNWSHARLTYVWVNLSLCFILDLLPSAKIHRRKEKQNALSTYWSKEGIWRCVTVCPLCDDTTKLKIISKRRKSIVDDVPKYQ